MSEDTNDTHLHAQVPRVCGGLNGKTSQSNPDMAKHLPLHVVAILDLPDGSRVIHDFISMQHVTLYLYKGQMLRMSFLR